MTLLLKIPSQLVRVATLPCRTPMFENKRRSQANVVINDESQGSVATVLRCGKIFNNRSFTNILLSLSVKKTFKIGGLLAKLQAKRLTGCFL